MKMDMDKKSVNSDIQSVSAKLVIVHGVVQNLPEIVDAIKEIYTLNKKEKIFGKVLQSQLDELNINKENFRVLVEGLTELSKSENADSETKSMYRDMIETLFGVFTDNMRSSQDISSYLNKF